MPIFSLQVRDCLLKVGLCENKSGRSLEDEQIQQLALDVQKAMKSPFASERAKKKLNHRMTSLLYRAGKCYGGEDPLPKPHPQLLDSLRESATLWKSKQIYYAETRLTEKENDALIQLARYPLMAEILLKDRAHADHFFKWALRNSLSVQVFVEFPVIVEKIERSLLRNRIGSFGGQALQFVDNDEGKDVTLLMEGKPVSLLDGKKQVVFEYGLTRTVDQIFQVFKNKNLKEGELAFFPEGVRNWDAHRISPVFPDGSLAKELDLEQDNWYLQLPMKAHFDTAEEASLYFGKKLDGKNFLATLVVTRITELLNTFGSHCFVRLLIPDGKGGYDYTYGFGKFAKEYPKSTLSSASLLGDVVEATIQNFDNNEQYTHRQFLEIHFLQSPEKGKAGLDFVRNAIRNARLGLLTFQILVQNCTDWVRDFLKHFVDDEKAKDLFSMPLTDLQVEGPFGVIMKLARKLPDRVNRIFFRVIELLILGFRSRPYEKNGAVKKMSIMIKHPYERDFHHPGMVWRNLNKVQPL